MSNKIEINGHTYEVPEGEILVAFGTSVYMNGRQVHNGPDRLTCLKVEVAGSPLFNLHTVGPVTVEGSVRSVETVGPVTVKGNVTAGIDTTGNVIVGGDVGGNIDTTGNVEVHGNCAGDIETVGEVKVNTNKKKE